MRTSRLFAAVLSLSFVAACQTASPENQATAREGLTARIKAQSPGSVDGGVASAEGSASTLTDQPPTITYTVTATQTATGTATGTITRTQTGTGTGTTVVTSTATNTATSTAHTTVTKVITDTTTSTGTTTTGTDTLSNTQTATGTKTFTATASLTGTRSGTKTGTLTSTGTASASRTATGTATWTGTYLGVGTATGTKIFTGTLSGTATATAAFTITTTGTKTNTASKTVVVTATGSGSRTTTQTYTSARTATTTRSATSTRTGTGTGTGTTTVTGTGTHSATATGTQVITKTTTGTATGTVTIPTTATGTSTVTVTNVCASTWAFCDNFETGNGSGWNVKQGPIQNFTVVPDGTKVYRQGDTSASQLYISQAQVGMTWMDSTVEASLKPLSFSSSSAIVTLWGRYDATWGADCGYYVGLRGDGKAVLVKRVAGVETLLGSPVAVSGGIGTGTWYDVKLDIQGTALKAYVNGTQLLTQTDSSCTSGSVGVGSVGASFEADDVRVTAPTTNTCVQNWRNTTTNHCGDFCFYEATQQSDRAGCGAYLDCYATHGCSPETCGGQDDVCGVNKPGVNGWGTASKEVADQVYKCLGCAGSVNCANPKYYNGTVCADGNPCTWGDTCQNKVCTPDPNRATQCAAADQCHGVGTCDTSTGICNNPNKPDTTTCNDGNLCTQTDVCQSGVCTGQNPVTCAPNDDQCHENVCQPASGACVDQAKQDGATCNDENACTQTDTCQGGACTGGNPVVCTTSDNCHAPGTCDTGTGTCSDQVPVDKIGCNVNLRVVDAVVNMGGDNWIALFGWNSTATSQFHPATTNAVSVDVGQVPSTSPNPPAYLIPGIHPGGFLAHFTTGQTITWTVDTQSKSASTSSPQLLPTPLPSGGGQEVALPDGTKVVITPDMDAYSKPPGDPVQTDEPAHGDAFNGALTGSLTTGPTGQAVYTVPISIPPGIAGMAPNLNLVYNSQGGDGIGGQGWDLKGLSMIYRCPKTRPEDGYAKTVDMDDISVESDSGDGLCLDGQRLFKVSAFYSEVAYETESKDFSSIITIGGPFLVTMKSGEKRIYGKTEHGQVLLPKEDSAGIVPPDAGAAGTVTAVWALEEVADPWGNYFEIHYNNDNNDQNHQSDFQNRGLIVTEIKYTAHRDAQGDKDVDPFNSITFSYDEPGGEHPRPDVRITRFRDSVLPVKSRLKTITTGRGTYSLTYKGEDPMLPSRLSQIDYCAGTTCLEPLQFGWKEGVYQWEISDAYKLPTAIHGPGTQFVDLDGDGLLDFVQARATEWASPGARRTWKNTGSGWVEKSNWALPDFLADAAGKLRGGVFVDMDGDGLPDFVADRWDVYCNPNFTTTTTQGYPWDCTNPCATT